MSCMLLITLSLAPTPTGTRIVRSPWAMRLSTRAASLGSPPRGRVTLRITRIATVVTSARQASTNASMLRRASL
ncbi:hypothetical protein D3C80_2120590 [compost metagenome]